MGKKTHKSLAYSRKTPTFAPTKSPDGGIGRRVGLKHQCRKACRFDPGSGYEAPWDSLDLQGVFFVVQHIFALPEIQFLSLTGAKSRGFYLNLQAEKTGNMQKLVSIMLKVVAPLAFAVAVLWWMYRGFPWDELMQAVRSDMRWEWMWLSFPFGISAQAFRALRWRQVLAPMGLRPRLSTCLHAVFFSYFSSLVVPRSGEVLRCGVLHRYEGISFSRGVGSVVTERVVDMSMVALFSLATVLTQLPVFIRFLGETGLSLSGFLQGFTATGYLVTAVCLAFIVITGIVLFRRLDFFSKTREMVNDFMDGMLSVRRVQRPWLFILYSVGIWVSYYLHFYLAFFCFDFTAGVGALAAWVAFVVGCFAVLVPTPNGAGPWHFAVKTVLVLYGVGETDAALFVLIVHTLQTLLIVVLGLEAMAALAFTPPVASLRDERLKN